MARKPQKGNKVQDSRGLTLKQRLFAEAIAKGDSVSDAVVQAGYSSVNAQTFGDKKLLTNSKILIYIAELREKASKGRIADANEVLTFLSDMMRGDIKAPKVTKDGIKDTDPDHAVRNDAAKTMAKYHKLLVDRVEQTGSNTIEITFNGDLQDWSE